MPGRVRRFIPKKGSGYVPFSTRAPTTVLGTVIADHAEASKPGCDTASPPAEAFSEDCRLQPSYKARRPAGCAWSAEADAHNPTATTAARRDIFELLRAPPTPRAERRARSRKRARATGT